MRARTTEAVAPVSLALTLYRLALLAFPRRVRSSYGEEMAAAFAMAYASRRDLGRDAARRFAARAWLDALLAGLRERLGRGGVGQEPPRGPLGTWTRSRADRLWTELGSDLRAALRSLRSAPAFTLTVIGVLALGVGVNGALLSAVRAAILAPAPYAESERLVLLDLLRVSTDQPGPGRPFPWSYPKYEILAGRRDLAAAPIAAYAAQTLTLTGGGEAVRLQAEIVTRDYFDVLALAPAAGRWPDDTGADERAIVLSHGLWQERYAADPAIVGATATLNGQPVSIVGVAPAGFRGLTGRATMWIPMRSVPHLISPSLLRNYDGHWLQVIGRMRPDATLETLAAQMDSVAASVRDAYEWSDPTSRVDGGARWLEQARRNPRAQRGVVVVSVAAALVLLIACANLAALMLARGSDRQRDIAVRLALGGSRFRVVRGLIVETVLLSLGGGLLAVLIATRATHAIAARWPANLADGGWNLRFIDASSFTVDATTVLFTLGLALGTGLLFALGPALRLTTTDLAAAMRDGLRATGARLGARRLLVAAEVAVALVLVVGATLMFSSLGQLLGVERGFDASRLLTFSYSLPRDHPAAGDPSSLHDELMGRLRTIPGVEDATIGCAPLERHCWISGVRRAGDVSFEEGHQPATGVHLVDERYFRTLGVSMVRGRDFDRSDDADSPAVVILNESAVRELFDDGTNPIGQRFATGIGLTSDPATAEIIGVVPDILHGSPAEGTMAESYFLERQEPDRAPGAILRTSGEPFDVLAAVRAEIAEVDPNLPIFAVTTVEAIMARQVGDTRSVTSLLAIFAGLALLLAATGMWGIVATSVAGRARELGIRMALGAESGSVVRLVLRQGLASALIGTVVGAAGALALSRVLTGLLFEVDPGDPRAFAIAAAVLIAVSLFAAWVPARRASALDPVETLRTE